MLDKIPAKFVYLFLTDLARTYAHDYESYAIAEPGYGKCMLRAYITAFSTETNGLMSEELINNIHREAMKFSPHSKPGEYKTSSNFIPVSPYDIEIEGDICCNPTYSMSKKGMIEFINYWMRDHPKPAHSISLEDKSEKQPIRAYAVESKNSEFVITTVKDDLKCFSQQCGVADVYDLIEKKMHNYSCEINLYIEAPSTEIPLLTSQGMQKIISDFNQKIVDADSPDKKIRVIAQHVQYIDQLHPRLDGNIRTCYILLNKLLRDHGLLLTLLMNPNRLDACSLDEIVDMIKLGQIHYQQLIQHTEGDLVLKSNNATDFEVIVCKPQVITDIPESLIQAFIECVIGGNREQYGLASNRNILWTQQEVTTPEISLSTLVSKTLSEFVIRSDKSNDVFFNAIRDEDYDLALRYACRHYAMKVIYKLISFEQCSFDLTKKSSNGYNAFSWLEKNTNLMESEKRALKSSLNLMLEKSNEIKYSL